MRQTAPQLNTAQAAALDFVLERLGGAGWTLHLDSTTGECRVQRERPTLIKECRDLAALADWVAAQDAATIKGPLL